MVSLGLAALAPWAVDLGVLQWSRRRRTQEAAVIAARRARFFADDAAAGRRNRVRSRVALALLGLLLLGGWAAYIWGAVTGSQ